jgi:hypothetical protein
MSDRTTPGWIPVSMSPSLEERVNSYPMPRLELNPTVDEAKAYHKVVKKFTPTRVSRQRSIVVSLEIIFACGALRSSSAHVMDMNPAESSISGTVSRLEGRDRTGRVSKMFPWSGMASRLCCMITILDILELHLSLALPLSSWRPNEVESSLVPTSSFVSLCSTAPLLFASDANSMTRRNLFSSFVQGKQTTYLDIVDLFPL